MTNYGYFPSANLTCNVFIHCQKLVGILLIASFSHAQTTPSAGMMRYPDVSADQIVFVYADDLWTVSRDGGMAIPLASPPGAERFPRFSPDGKTIAFQGNYEGGQDVYTIPAKGGIAERLTFHPDGKVFCDWHPDGVSLLYATAGFSGLGRQLQLFTISAKEPLPHKLPVPYGSNGAVSADGKWLAYTPHSRDHRTWKRYRGGMASDIWLFHLETHVAKQITDFEGTDSLPMWHGKTVYYLSDAGQEHRLNIWSYDTESSQRSQVTKFDEYDCKWPAIGPDSNEAGEIVLQNGAHLYLIDLESGKERWVEISIPGDRPQLRKQRVDAAEFIASADISPSGKRIVLEARGDIWSLPAKEGATRNLTHSSGSAERFPSWSPDGQWIAYFGDESGEYELYVTQSDGRGTTRQLTHAGKCYRYNPVWSPDSKFIVFTDKTGGIYLYSFDSADTKRVAVDPYADNVDVNWSHNSEWITYALNSETKAPTTSVWVYNVKDGTQRKLTSGYFPDHNPTFDRKGDFVFFSSNRAFNSPRYEDLGTTFIYDNTEVLMGVPLRRDVKLPFQPTSDEESWGKDDESEDQEKNGDDEDHDHKNQDDKDRDEKDQGDKDHGNGQGHDASVGATGQGNTDHGRNHNGVEKNGSRDKNDEANGDGSADKQASQVEDTKPFEIEFDEIERRAFQIPVDQGNFGPISINHKNQLVFGRRAGQRGGKASIQLFDLKDDERKPKTIVSGTGNFGMSANGKKLLVFRDKAIFIVSAAPKQELKDAIDTSAMKTMVDPRSEWRQMLVDAWRIERDFFYDPNMHGVDWPGVRRRYEAMLPDCVSRRDLSFLISEMISEINVGHAYYRESQLDNGPSGNAGLLGCRFERDEHAYKIAELYEGAPWDVDARNPLRSAGVKPGEYLLAINSIPLTVDQSPYALLQGLAGKTVTLTISRDAFLDDPESVASAEDDSNATDGSNNNREDDANGDAKDGAKDGAKDDVKDGDEDGHDDTTDRLVNVKALSGDGNLRFRAEIERLRKYVDEKTDGKVGYIYVVDTGTPGQNDLVRQYFAQLNKSALIIDDRWNGGGQIPTRFIELLNRPVTNYWAKRDGQDWTWPPDAHHGPKCMLINGMAGSGGDMFPALFKQAQLGKLIGMRTWGGLVGISGNPGLIDGAGVTAPTFAFYEKDGTWGIEGHGVDPDIQVIDDPEKMADGRDPQLDVAIELMSHELKTNPYQKPDRPKYPDRSKFGIAPEDK